MKKEALYWRCQIVGWGLYNLYNVYIYLALTSGQLSYKFILLILFSFLELIFFTHIYLLYIRKQRWARLSYSKLFPRVIIACLLLSFINMLSQSFIAYYTNLPKSRESFNLAASLLSSTILTAGLFIAHFGWSLIYFLYQYIEQRNQSLKDEAAMKDFELNKLKSQLNPHFIFNALNSIRALVDEDPLKCKEAINQLSNILRNSLSMDKQKLIPFEEELRSVKDYLALETIRFEERLKYEINIHPATFTYKVPPLMIQTLVENGIKHGISQLKEGGILKLETEVLADKGLIIRIRNNGMLKINGENTTGQGLANTQRRLKLLFGERAYFKISNEHILSLSQGTLLSDDGSTKDFLKENVDNRYNRSPKNIAIPDEGNNIVLTEIFIPNEER